MEVFMGVANSTTTGNRFSGPSVKSGILQGINFRVPTRRVEYYWN
jgi:hypothetical protein